MCHSPPLAAPLLFPSAHSQATSSWATAHPSSQSGSVAPSSDAYNRRSHGNGATSRLRPEPFCRPWTHLFSVCACCRFPCPPYGQLGRITITDTPRDRRGFCRPLNLVHSRPSFDFLPSIHVRTVVHTNHLPIKQWLLALLMSQDGRPQLGGAGNRGATCRAFLEPNLGKERTANLTTTSWNLRREQNRKPMIVGAVLFSAIVSVALGQHACALECSPWETGFFASFERLRDSLLPQTLVKSFNALPASVPHIARAESAPAPLLHRTMYCTRFVRADQ